MRVLAVDPGGVKVGLALSDETETLATPLRTLRGGSGIERRIADAVKESGAELVVVGLAVRLDGREGPEAGQARALAQRLAALTGVPVELWDERFTTELAARLRRGNPGRRRGSGDDDAAAAAVLLQSYLDRGQARR